MAAPQGRILAGAPQLSTFAASRLFSIWLRNLYAVTCLVLCKASFVASDEILFRRQSCRHGAIDASRHEVAFSSTARQDLCKDLPDAPARHDPAAAPAMPAERLRKG